MGQPEALLMLTVFIDLVLAVSWSEQSDNQASFERWGHLIQFARVEALSLSLDERQIRVANPCGLDLCVAFDHCRDDPVILQLRGLNDCADGCSPLSVTVSGSSP